MMIKWKIAAHTISPWLISTDNHVWLLGRDREGNGVKCQIASDSGDFLVALKSQYNPMENSSALIDSKSMIYTSREVGEVVSLDLISGNEAQFFVKPQRSFWGVRCCSVNKKILVASGGGIRGGQKWLGGVSFEGDILWEDYDQVNLASLSSLNECFFVNELHDCVLAVLRYDDGVAVNSISIPSPRGNLGRFNVCAGSIYLKTFPENATLHKFDGILNLQWKQCVGGFNAWMPPTLDRGRLFLVHGDSMYCLSDQTGEVIWRQAIALPHEDNSASAAPLVHNGCVYIGSKNKCLWCLDTKSGEIIDRFETPTFINAAPVTNGEFVYFVDVSGMVYCVTQGNS